MRSNDTQCIIFFPVRRVATFIHSLLGGLVLRYPNNQQTGSVRFTTLHEQLTQQHILRYTSL